MARRKKDWWQRQRRLLGLAWQRWRRLFRRRARHLVLGRLGERASRRALAELGLDILCCNYRNRRGEIDIVAREDGVLCFIEVKSRSVGGLGRPADAVDAVRRRRYVRSANLYMRSLCPVGVIPHRYDIMEVEFRGFRVCGMRYWRNAFTDRAVFGTPRPSAF